MDADTRAQGVPSSSSRGLRALILSVAIIESIEALTGLPVLLGDLSEIPGPGLGGWTIIASLVMRPVFAIAALVLAIRGQMRNAVLALAAVVLVNWFNMLPSVVLHGLEFRGSGSLYASAHFLLSPLLALAAATLAWNNQRLGLAGFLASVPTLANVLGLIAFAILIMIYGF